MVKRILIVGAPKTGASLLAAHIAVRAGGTWNCSTGEFGSHGRRLQAAWDQCAEKGPKDAKVCIVDTVEWLSRHQAIDLRRPVEVPRLFHAANDADCVAAIYTMRDRGDLADLLPQFRENGSLVSAMDVVLRTTRNKTSGFKASVLKGKEPADNWWAGEYAIFLAGNGRPFCTQTEASVG
jgi:hypothetical protein